MPKFSLKILLYFTKAVYIVAITTNVSGKTYKESDYQYLEKQNNVRRSSCLYAKR